jgi:hypothetical protein
MESSMKDLETNFSIFKLRKPLDPQVPPCHGFSRGPIYATGPMVGTITVIMQGKYCQKFVGKMNENTFINCLRLFR